jgi:hypothetical protein
MWHKVGYAKVMATIAAFVTLAGVVSVTAVWADVRLLPLDLVWPPVLEPGTYETQPFFTPRTTFTVSRGWNGAQETYSFWGVGKGLNGHLATPCGSIARESFDAVGICVFRLALPYTAAVSRFKMLTTLMAGPSKRIQMAGYPGVSFHAVVPGDRSLLRGMGVALPVGVLPGGQQIFLNVRGTTLLLRIETSARDAGEEAAVRGLLRTMRFPR